MGEAPLATRDSRRIRGVRHLAARARHPGGGQAPERGAWHIASGKSIDPQSLSTTPIDVTSMRILKMKTSEKKAPKSLQLKKQTLMNLTVSSGLKAGCDAGCSGKTGCTCNSNSSDMKVM
jgi:hypothetical protein